MKCSKPAPTSVAYFDFEPKWPILAPLGFSPIALMAGPSQSQGDSVASEAPEGGPMFLSSKPSKRSGCVEGRGRSAIACCGRSELAGESTLRQDVMAER